LRGGSSRRGTVDHPLFRGARHLGVPEEGRKPRQTTFCTARSTVVQVSGLDRGRKPNVGARPRGGECRDSSRAHRAGDRRRRGGSVKLDARRSPTGRLHRPPPARAARSTGAPSSSISAPRRGNADGLPRERNRRPVPLVRAPRCAGAIVCRRHVEGSRAASPFLDEIARPTSFGQAATTSSG